MPVFHGAARRGRLAYCLPGTYALLGVVVAGPVPLLALRGTMLPTCKARARNPHAVCDEWGEETRSP